MMCDLAHCCGEGTTCLQFHDKRAQLRVSNTRVPVGKMFDSQSVWVAQTPCEQCPLNKIMRAWISLLICSFGPSLIEVTGKRATLNSVFGCGVVLENPSFISSYHSLQKVGLTFHTIQEFPRNQHTIVLLFIGQFFRTSLAQIFLMCRSSVMNRWMSIFGSPTSSAINRTLTSVPIQKSLYTGHIVLSS